MREIKFRGKRKDTGEWVYGDITHHDGVVSYVGQHPADGTMVVYDLDPATVGQYTGLKDKNGMEIYEGDVMRVTNSPLVDDKPYYIYWDEELSGWQWKDNNSEDCWGANIAKHSEIIGNIHDNKGVSRRWLNS